MNDSYMLLLTIKNGLPYLDIQPCADHQWDNLLHAVLASDVDWDPSVFDSPGGIHEEEWHVSQSSLPEGPSSLTFNEFGELRNLTLAHELFYFDAESYDTENELDNLVDTCVVDSRNYLINNSNIISATALRCNLSFLGCIPK